LDGIASWYLVYIPSWKGFWKGIYNLESAGVSKKDVTVVGWWSRRRVNDAMIFSKRLDCPLSKPAWLPKILIMAVPTLLPQVNGDDNAHPCGGGAIS
jgi:hypothetical protein